MSSTLKFPKAMKELKKLPPIRKQEEYISTGDYRYVPVQSDHPLFDEELVDICDCNIAGESYYFRGDRGNQPYCRRLDGSIPKILVRKSVAEKLMKVNQRLKCLGIELFVWDAYRPLETQIGIWQFFENDQLKKYPSKSNKEIYNEVLKYVSDPSCFHKDDSSTWPTHMTGASVDLTLRSIEQKEELDMGAHFDQMDDIANMDYFENQLAYGNISEEDPRLLYRRLLYYAMTESDFTNYPFEFWHFDWGNQMHQKMKSIISGTAAEVAFYGAIS